MPKKNKKIAFTVTLKCPEGAKPPEVRDFIFAAIAGQHSVTDKEDDPMFKLDMASVRVKRASVV